MHIHTKMHTYIYICRKNQQHLTVYFIKFCHVNSLTLHKNDIFCFSCRNVGAFIKLQICVGYIQIFVSLFLNKKC